MKLKLIALAICVVATTAIADKQSDDYAHFERWLEGVYTLAPLVNLELHPGAEDEEEFFYLYCWQSDDHTIGNALRMAKRVWRKKSR